MTSVSVVYRVVNTDWGAVVEWLAHSPPDWKVVGSSPTLIDHLARSLLASLIAQGDGLGHIRTDPSWK